LLKRVISLFMAVLTVLALACTTTAFAAEEAHTLPEDVESYIENSITAINDSGVSFSETWLRSWLTTDESKAQSLEDGGRQYNITLGSSQGVLYIVRGKTEEGLIEAVQKSVNNAATVDDVSTITDGLNIGADTAGATALLSGFAPIISLVVGVIVVLVTMGMTLFTAFDIAYIAFPVFRNKCEEQKMNGTGYNVKKDSNGNVSLRFVTDDAQYAVSEGTIENGKSPWGIYFRKRIMSYVLLAIVLFILLTGNISLITNIALNIVSGIMNVLSGLA
jgi:hypothetical protein